MNAAHVLVVDDEPDIRELVKDILEDEGYRVTPVADGKGARDALRAGRPDLILLDIWMPDVDGITLLKGQPGALTKGPTSQWFWQIVWKCLKVLLGAFPLLPANQNVCTSFAPPIPATEPV